VSLAQQVPIIYTEVIFDRSQCKKKMFRIQTATGIMRVFMLQVYNQSI